MSTYETPPPDLATQFRRILSIHKERRSPVDVDIIYGHLREIQAISQLPESSVRQMAENARYQIHESNETMYMEGDLATCWYILLSGSVYLEGCMYLPGSSFGKQTKSGRRASDCLILERSEMIVIDYPNDNVVSVKQRSYSSDNLDELISYGSVQKQYQDRSSEEELPHQLRQMKDMLQKSEPYLDQMGRQDKHDTNKKNMYNARNNKGGSSLDDFDLDLSGLKETVVDLDSEDDDEIEPSESAVVRDIVRDCLEKEPSGRTENDINILMDFMQHLPAFSKLTHNIKVEMCKVMVFAVVDKAGAVVMSDGEEMDSWSVILNGSVEIVFEDQSTQTLHLGDPFGVETTPETMFHKGTMKTRVDDCQFVCIAQNDYWRIFSQGEASCHTVEEEGEVVMVTEHRVTDGGSRQGQVVIKGTPDRLLDHLMEDHSVIDPTYVEDFLLTFVVFFNKPHDIASKLLKWFERPQLKDKVTRVMLLWVNNHFSDFEGDGFMEASMERFEYLLEARKMVGQLRLLNMACSAKSKPRIITLQRPSKESRLDFSICGGKDRGFAIFISKVDYDSRASDLGLKRGDQVLEVNGQSFENITGPKAIDVLMSHAHLCLIVKTNTIGFKEVIQPSVRKSRSNNSLDDSHKSSGRLSLNELLPGKKSGGISRSASDVNYNKGKKGLEAPHDTSTHSSISGSLTLPRNSKLRKAILKLTHLPRSSSEKEINKIDMQNDNGQQFTRYFTRPASDKANQHTSNDSNSQNAGDDTMDLNSHVIKCYRGDHTSRFFVLTKDTIAREVVATAIDAFGITDYASKAYFLCEVTVTEDGLIKQKRLPDVANNLANRISLNGRYYIKSSISEGPISDEVALEISREANLTLFQLSPLDIAKELTLQDFELFRNVDSREYIYNLFESKNERKSKNLRCVEQTTNTEMFWVISEICSEMNITKRVKLLKYFIKVAKFCKDFKNYNSMYAIISGLENSSVTRLKNTWEKLPQKYDKILQDLKELMDPSRNMSKYRNLFNGDKCYPPLIPWFPIVKKDITFLHLGNDTKVDGLINFEKLRMIAREVRRICKFCAIGYDPYKMDTLQDNHGDGSNVALSVVSIMSGAPNRRSGRGSIAMNNPKKAYEEFQTSRRIRQYLEKLSFKEYNEKELQELSYNCEPPPSLNTPVNSQKRKPMSPLPSPADHKRKEEKLTSKSSNASISSRDSRDSDRMSIISASAPAPMSHALHTPPTPRAAFGEDDHKHDSFSPRKKPLPNSNSSSTLSSRNGSVKSIASSGYHPYPEFVVDTDQMESPTQFDDDDHGQVSMV